MLRHAMFDADPSVINWTDFEGRTALHLAVADSDTDAAVVRVLLGDRRVQVGHGEDPLIIFQ